MIPSLGQAARRVATGCRASMRVALPATVVVLLLGWSNLSPRGVPAPATGRQSLEQFAVSREAAGGAWAGHRVTEVRRVG